MAEETLAQLLMQDNGQALRNGFMNGARNFGNQAAWTIGGMNGPQPTAIYGTTPNQYVDQNWPAMAEQGRQVSPTDIMQLIQRGRMR